MLVSSKLHHSSPCGPSTLGFYIQPPVSHAISSIVCRELWCRSYLGSSETQRDQRDAGHRAPCQSVGAFGLGASTAWLEKCPFRPGIPGCRDGACTRVLTRQSGLATGLRPLTLLHTAHTAHTVLQYCTCALRRVKQTTNELLR